ncbi:MAG: hypothetical protein ABSF29_16615 [Tepidisphaeraceae bacterium]|jgi:hypothetical protein
MTWTRERIIRDLARLRRAGKDISYNAMARKEQALLSAAAYHFRSYRRAVEQAGMDYVDVLRRPWWTRKKIIEMIKKARRKGQDLHWSAVSRRGDLLGRAALASLQQRLFGKWSRALKAAGLDARDISRYHRWDRKAVLAELRTRARKGEPMNSGRLQKLNSPLHAAAVRYFGNYEAALIAAKFKPGKFRQRRKWDRASVVQEIRAAKQGGKRLSDSSVRRENPALYGAAVRWFGSFPTARKKAGIQFRRSKIN